MSGQMRGRAWGGPAIKGLTAIAIARGTIVNSPVLGTAGETPPAILKEERDDPAAGEIVIINRRPVETADAKKDTSTGSGIGSTSAETTAEAASKTAVGQAPATKAPRRSISAPRASEPGPSDALSRRGRTNRRSSSRTARPLDEPDREQMGAPLPPLPRINAEIWARRSARAAGDVNSSVKGSRPSRADDRNHNADAANGRRRAGRDDDDARDVDSRPRHRWRNDILHPPPGYRPRTPDGRHAEQAWRRHIEERPYYRERGPRPRRLCRRLAWRCEDGFDRACWRWRRICR